MTPRDPRATVERYVEILRTGDLDGLDEILAPDVHDHVGRRSGIAWWKEILAVVREGFSDTEVTVDHVLVDGDLCALHLTVTGRHTGRFLPQLGRVTPSGKRFTWAQAHLFRVVDGLVTEHWAVRDDLGLAKQVGAVVPAGEPTATGDVPTLDGVHHLKLPVAALDRSIDWYASRLGYRKGMEFVEDGVVVGVGLVHPAGGPQLGLRCDPTRAAAAAGFDYFSIGVPDREAIEALAERLTRLGDRHAGVHFASVGWILPGLHDPDGHEVRFYTTAGHSDPAGIARVHDARESGEQRARAVDGGGADPRTGLEPPGRPG